MRAPVAADAGNDGVTPLNQEHLDLVGRCHPVTLSGSSSPDEPATRSGQMSVPGLWSALSRGVTSKKPDQPRHAVALAAHVEGVRPARLVRISPRQHFVDICTFGLPFLARPDRALMAPTLPEVDAVDGLGYFPSGVPGINRLHMHEPTLPPSSHVSSAASEPGKRRHRGIVCFRTRHYAARCAR
jgi:hypothetical protein